MRRFSRAATQSGRSKLDSVVMNRNSLLSLPDMQRQADEVDRVKARAKSGLIMQQESSAASRQTGTTGRR